MKTILILALMAAAIPAPAAQLAYSIVPGDNLVELRVDKTGLLRGKSHRFTFERYRAELRIDPGELVKSSVTLTLQANSVTCRDTWLSAKDLAKVQAYAVHDMLMASSYPQIRFVSGSIRIIDAAHFEVAGTLTLRGISKPAAVHVEVMFGEDGLARFQGTASVRLTDYGLKPPTAALGTIGTRNEMEFRFQIAARAQMETD